MRVRPRVLIHCCIKVSKNATHKTGIKDAIIFITNCLPSITPCGSSGCKSGYHYGRSWMQRAIGIYILRHNLTDWSLAIRTCLLRRPADSARGPLCMRHRALALHPPPLYFCGRGEWGWVCKLAALRRHTQRWWSSWVHLHFSPLVERRLCQKERGEVLFYCFSAGWNLQTTSSAQHKSCRSVLNMLMLDVNELQASLNFTTSATWCIKLCFCKLQCS